MLSKHSNGKTKIVILGGGTAGWLTANLLNSHLGNTHEICLVESPNIPTIGVGEGSTPQLKHFFDAIGVDEHQWMHKCDATYKLGIKFTGWSEDRNVESYFHPFSAQVDMQWKQAFLDHVQWRRQGVDVHAHPDDFFLNSELGKTARSPIAKASFPFNTTYGYHFDSAKLAIFLSEHALHQGVNVLFDEIVDVKKDSNNNVSSLLGKKYKIEGDFFIDCSGFKSILNSQVFETSYRSYNGCLQNNAAVTLRSDHIHSDIMYTESIAMKHGWMWIIPLENRTGYGYVFDTTHCNYKQAEDEIRERLGLVDSEVTVNQIHMNTGRYDKHWQQNCLSVGLSQGFIEPLEATGIHLILSTLECFIKQYKQSNHDDASVDSFNLRINNQFDNIKDYIVAHYVTSAKSATAYWQQASQQAVQSEPLHAVLSAWMSGKSLLPTLQKYDLLNAYNETSWNCLLAGNGVFPTQEQLKMPIDTDSPYDILEMKSFFMQCAKNYTQQAFSLTKKLPL